MTSQLILMNQMAVAVASDTLTSRVGQSDTKTWPSHSKIYELPAPALGVVAHCGSVALQDADWRLLVRDWSTSLESLSAPRMVDYVDFFTEWIHKNASTYFLSDARGVESRLTASLRGGGQVRYLAGALDSHLRDALRVDPVSFDEDIATAIRSHITENFSTDSFQGDSEESMQAVFAASNFDLMAHFRFACELSDDAVIGPMTQDALREFAIAALLRPANWGNNSMALAFAGYGTQENLGHCVILRIYGYWGGRLRFTSEEGGSSNPGDYPIIVPLAQSSAMESFLYGFNFDVMDVMEEILENDLKVLGGLEQEKIDSITDSVTTKWSTHLRTHFMEPAFETVGTLGISNLCKFAEFLIHLQAFRSATDDTEATVGGLIESVVIAPERGVRWRSRISSEIHRIESSSHVFE